MKIGTILLAVALLLVQIVTAQAVTCISDCQCESVAGSTGKCLGCDLDDGSSECPYGQDRGSSGGGSKSKDGKGKDGKSKDGKSKRRRLKGDDDDDSGGDDPTTSGPIFSADCCDCNCRAPCTCTCYGFVFSDSGSSGGSSKSKGKDGKSKRRLSDEESHVRSRISKRNNGVVEENGDESWHSWIVGSIWGKDDAASEQQPHGRKLKEIQHRQLKGDDDDDDSGSGGGGGGGGGDDDGGSTDCTRPPVQCTYTKFIPGESTTCQSSSVCAANTFGTCEMRQAVG